MCPSKKCIEFKKKMQILNKQVVTTNPKVSTVQVNVDMSQKATILGYSLVCIDYRFIDPEDQYLNEQGFQDNYDEFILAGATLGFNQTEHPSWKQAYLDHFEIAAKLHGFKKIITIDHMDCGAYKIFYNDPNLSKERERDLHIQNINAFKKFMKVKYPGYPVVSYLMDIDGSAMEIT